MNIEVIVNELFKSIPYSKKQEKNATCTKLENGNMKCTLDKELTSGEDVRFEYNTDILTNTPEVEYNHTPGCDELTLTINGNIKEN